MVRSPYRPIISNDASASMKDSAKFDPAKHIAFERPSKIYRMTDIGYTDETGVSPIAASEPFQLFSQDAIEQFRSEILQQDVMENCNYSGDLGCFMLRGYAAKYAPFVYDAWHNPEVLNIVSTVAGVDLVPVMDYEIGHINISVKSEEQAIAERNSASQVKQSDDSSPVVGWHKDSYPFVCVTMLSDCTNMIGGETVIRTENGQAMRIRGPSMGCAVVLQGRYITHQALRALGAQERITMVTSFRPRSPQLADDSVLGTVRGVSNLSDLYFGYSEYRLQIMQERCRMELIKLRKAHTEGMRTDTKAVRAFLTSSIEFLQSTKDELVPDEDVVPGQQPTMDIPDEVVGSSVTKLLPTPRAKL
ncbi:hypothetical protein AMS68_005633 [Peltaster fructicola]|uniref:Fe2OG dioxygenase domain-containing protein n=1 Tax=Peltaster fructicola TaxID=286661 RepID=A0A6H0XZL1_9PEZI|nr:hypothetical protein AMS68_005633 [Peltaster fructicola]